MPHAPRAFTLIELLVVVTIVVVLVALLAPALDKAVYQAGLAVCSGQLDGVSMGVGLYAVDHRNRYPWRSAIHVDNSSMKPEDLRVPPNEQRVQGPRVDAHDLRPVVRGYVRWEQFRDPLTGNVSLDEEDTHDYSNVLAGYTLWFGFQYRQGSSLPLGVGPPGENRDRGMFKVGDRMTYHTYTFNLLAADRHGYGSIAGGTVSLSHPDHDGVLGLEDRQDTGDPPYKMTYSSWGRVGGTDHGLIDLNYAYQDGSVRRLSNLAGPDTSQPAPDDYPLRLVPFATPTTLDREYHPNQVWIPHGE